MCVFPGLWPVAEGREGQGYFPAPFLPDALTQGLSGQRATGWLPPLCYECHRGKLTRLLGRETLSCDPRGRDLQQSRRQGLALVTPSMDIEKAQAELAGSRRWVQHRNIAPLGMNGDGKGKRARERDRLTARLAWCSWD